MQLTNNEINPGKVQMSLYNQISICQTELRQTVNQSKILKDGNYC